LHCLHPFGLHLFGWLQYFACFLPYTLQWWPHFVMVDKGVHIVLQRPRLVPQNLVGAWLHHSPILALVHHCSISAAPEFLHKVAHNFRAHLLLIQLQKNLLL
jgi:hypothetical protein